MAISFSCKCAERKKPIAERKWFVLARNYHASAFNGYRWAYSEYSTVQCDKCRAVGRTKAAYVQALPDRLR